MIPSINTKKLTESAKGLFATIREDLERIQRI